MIAEKKNGNEAITAEAIGAAVTTVVNVLIRNGVMDAADGMVSLYPPTMATEQREAVREASDSIDQVKDDIEDESTSADSSDLFDIIAEIERKCLELKKEVPDYVRTDYECSLPGFFEFMGDTDAISILNDYFGDAYVSDEEESLRNLKASVEVLRETNRLREARGHEPLEVSSVMMAIAAIDADAVLRTGDSPQIYNVSEITGIGDDTPLAWLADEEEHFINRTQGSVSRYAAIMADHRSVMGASVIGEHSIYCQTFDWWASEHAYDGLRKGKMTVEEYCSKMDIFMKLVEIRKLEDSICRINDAIHELEQCNAQITNKGE